MRKMGELYLHVGNSGITFSVIDEGYGPTIKAEQGAFGNLGVELTVKTTKEGLERLGLMYLEASREAFSEPYCHAAEPTDRRRRTGRGEQAQSGGTQWMSGKGKTTMAEVLELLREKARAADDFYEEKINGRTRRLKAIDTPDGRLIIDIDDSSWVHDPEWIESVDRISVIHPARSAEEPPRTCVETAFAILKARALFTSSKQGGARLMRSEIQPALHWQEIEELVALGLIYVQDGRVMFREEAPLSAVVSETYVNTKLPRLKIKCDHNGGDEYFCVECAPAASAAEAATINANTERMWDAKRGTWVPKP